MFLLLIGIIIYEIRTKLIPDIIVIPAGIYFVIAACFVGSKPWWHYPLGLIALFFIFLICANILFKITGHVSIGGGTIKLFAVIGAALGIIMGLQVALVFIISGCIFSVIANIFFEMQILPTSPFILFSVLCTLFWNYGFRLIKDYW